MSFSTSSLNETFYKNSNSFSGVNFTLQVFENDYMGLFPECFCIFCALFLTLYGVVITTSEKHFYPLALNPLRGLTVLTFFYTLLLIYNSPIKNAIFLYHSFIIDDSASLFKIFICCSAIGVLCISLDSLKSESISNFEYCICILLSTCGMFFLVSAGDLIIMYLAIELQSLCFYVLAAFKRNSEFSTEAGLKYFLLGAFSSGILLFGCSLVYGFTGGIAFSEYAQIYSCGNLLPTTFSAHELSSNIHSSNLFSPYSIGSGVDFIRDLGQNFGYEVSQSIASGSAGSFGLTGSKGDSLSSLSMRGCELGMLFILIGLLFKLSAVPFHMWAPDVYEGSPTAITAFFAIVNKASFLCIFFRFIFLAFYDLNFQWQTGLCLCSIASMVVGSFLGLAQQRLKRLLAWSAISHAGYLLICLCCDTLEGVQAGVIYLVVYMIVSTSIFSVILAPIRRDGGTESAQLKYTSDLYYLGKSNPLVAATLTLSLFSLAGIPPLAGFYGKAYLFWAAINSSLYVTAFFGILTSAVSAFYYIRIVKIMYFESSYKSVKSLNFAILSKESAYITGICFIFNLCFLFYPKPLYLAGLQVGLCFL